MSNEFSQAQREILKKMVNDSLAKVISRPDEPEGDPKVPDTKKSEDIARKIAREEIAKIPKWWQFRKLSEKIVGGSLAAIILSTLISLMWDLGWNNSEYFQKTFRAMNGTVEQVDERVLVLLDEFGKEPNTPGGKKFRELIDDWAQADQFKESSRGVFRSLADQRDESFEKLVRQVRDTNPIMLFQVEGLLGFPREVSVAATGCKNLVEFLLKLPRDLRPKGEGPALVAKFCTANAILRDSELSLTFWGQMRDTQTADADEVHVIVQVQSMAARTTARGISSNIEKRLGFRVLYNPTSGDPNSYNPELDIEDQLSEDTLNLSAQLEDAGNGFWYGRVDGKIRAHIANLYAQSGKPKVYHLVHQLMIEQDRPGENTICAQSTDKDFLKPDERACEPYLVKLIVILNKAPE